MERIAVIPGSFDPITNGHADLVMRAAALADRVEVLVMENADKHTMFTPQQRLQIAQAAFAGLSRVQVVNYRGLLCRYVKEQPGRFLVKGARNSVDFQYEYTLYEINRELEDCETVILPAKKENLFLSSTFVRELIRYGRSLEGYVPPESQKVIEQLLAH